MTTEIHMLTKDQVVDKLMHSNVDSLREMCYYAHKDHYGIKGHHLLNYSVPELVSWWISHYDWNENHQYWDTLIPFDNDNYEERSNEVVYYAQFG